MLSKPPKKNAATHSDTPCTRKNERKSRTTMNAYDISRIHLDEIDSTNLYAASLPAPRENEMVVITADMQTAGRGQRGNSWESEKGKNITFSIMCAPSFIRPAAQFSLLQAQALALYDVIGSLIPDVSIKWPNDIYAGNRKISGTLIECEIDNGKISKAIIGTGINVNQRTFLSDAPNPTSLAIETGCEFDTAAILNAVVGRFTVYYEMLRSNVCIQKTYRNALYRRESFFTYHDNAGFFTAEIAGIEPDGHIVLRDSEGRKRRYAFKEVAFVI